jgi:hypothetical protein
MTSYAAAGIVGVVFYWLALLRPWLLYASLLSLLLMKSIVLLYTERTINFTATNDDEVSLIFLTGA